MKLTDDYWLEGVKQVPSPHYDTRPSSTEVSLLVVHNISLPPGQFGSQAIEQFFTGKLLASDHPFFAVIASMRVSAHCLIRRDGEIVQFVPFNMRAWHAGKSSFAGRERCNDYSIGIELEGTDFECYSKQQYVSLARVTSLLMRYYPLITRHRITGHQYIAPLRKSDPGLVFDWRYFHHVIDELVISMSD
ncbi:1,6-anhydro-N-acetylmuramyl-L-alanine amidase AmpD [Vibrio sp. TH_r3]|uniref:1,6-anhydro-N-acetylmuramyl-L-alanine amidase AmpD n=1 Tax=Vibrio sp. TH_r3 TaxID=3082084 RepID=UPI002955B305|nr:1,6-anhydro-N-acetylmuramyl-L-alanine amidase AmpD [Vibrio sp. TH_r3]MDV7104459.1 1,6-anhydro-N-acetylmuramyl-L-alanine amidase AmpD [Vibrio sp. TH_r3]